MRLRTLSDAPPRTTTVATADELRAAAARGDSHIALLDHLDLRTGGVPGAAEGALDATHPALLTIRGNCSGPAPTTLLEDAAPATGAAGGQPPLLPLRPRQCLVLLDTPLFAAQRPDSLWLDGLYLRIGRSGAGRPASGADGSGGGGGGREAAAAAVHLPTPAPAAPRQQRRRLWLTDTAVQGPVRPEAPDRAALASGVHVEGGRMLADRCTFANLGGSGGGGMDGAPVEVSGGSADFVNCAFLNNAVADGSHGVVLGRGGASVALRGCTFAGNAGHLLQVGADTDVEEAARGASEAAPPATFFSDDPSVSVCQLPGGFEDPSGIAESDTGRRQMQAALVRMGQDLGSVHRPLHPPAAAAAGENQIGCCAVNCIGLSATGPTAADGGATVSAATGLGLPVPEARASTTGDDPGEVPLDSPGAVGLAATALAIAAAALVVVVVYGIRLRQRRQRFLARRNAHAIAKADMHDNHDCGAPTVPTDEAVSQSVGASGGSLSFFYHLKTPSKLSDGNSHVLHQASSSDLPLDVSPTATYVPVDCVLPLPSIFSGLQPCSPRPDGEGPDEIAESSAQSVVRSSEATGDLAWPDHPMDTSPTMAHRLRQSQDGVAESCVAAALPGDSMAHGGVLPVIAEASVIERADTFSAAAEEELEEAPSLPSDMLPRPPVPRDGPLFGAWGRPDVRPAARADATPSRAAAGDAASMEVGGSRRLARGASSGSPATCGDGGRAVVPAVRDEAAPVQAQLAIIGQQLAAFGPRDLLLGRYAVVGGQDQCHGGRAVVQFVKVPRTGDVCALKFFASRAAFEGERRLYQHSTAGRFMPTVLAFEPNEDGRFCDPFDNPMPPCIVMEKGELLTERSPLAADDVATIAQVMCQVAQCLAQLHEQGWVHRALTPATIMFLPRTGAWALINMDLAARFGEPVPVAYTRAYAAPEVVAAHTAESPVTVAAPAVDAWALGVIAFELLTGKPAFHLLSGGVEEARRQLLGLDPLPWEDGLLMPPAQQRLGHLWTPLLRMLCRDPAQRASCADFAAVLRSASPPEL